MNKKKKKRRRGGTKYNKKIPIIKICVFTFFIIVFIATGLFAWYWSPENMHKRLPCDVDDFVSDDFMTDVNRIIEMENDLFVDTAGMNSFSKYLNEGGDCETTSHLIMCVSEHYNKLCRFRVDVSFSYSSYDPINFEWGHLGIDCKSRDEGWIWIY